MSHPAQRRQHDQASEATAHGVRGVALATGRVDAAAQQL
jgi:hypothetical protein